MGLAAGIGFGVALMVLIEYLDKTLKSEADVTAALNLLVLATVPILPEIGSRAGAAAEADCDLSNRAVYGSGRRGRGRMESLEIACHA